MKALFALLAVTSCAPRPIVLIQKENGKVTVMPPGYVAKR